MGIWQRWFGKKEEGAPAPAVTPTAPASPGQPSVDVFISHVEEDQRIALALRTGLRQAGYHAWCYEEDSILGVEFLEQITTAIDQTRAFLILISTHTLGSQHVDRELFLAYNGKVPILPLLLGVSWETVRKRRSTWAMMIGATVALPITEQTVASLLPRVIQGLHAKGVVPGDTVGTAVPVATPVPPPPTPTEPEPPPPTPTEPEPPPPDVTPRPIQATPQPPAPGVGLGAVRVSREAPAGSVRLGRIEVAAGGRRGQGSAVRLGAIRVAATASIPGSQEG